MPRSEYITTCIGCGCSIHCGDCIEHVCNVCEGKIRLLREFGYTEVKGFLISEWIVEGSGSTFTTSTSIAYTYLLKAHPELPTSPDTLWFFHRKEKAIK